MSRIEKENCYLEMAQTISQRSTCRRYHCGVVIANEEEIIATGYNGAPKGRDHCTDLEQCAELEGKPCRGVPAEVNAIAAADHKACRGATLYMACVNVQTGEPEARCPGPYSQGLIINAGISRVVVLTAPGRYEVYNVPDWVFNDDTLPGV